MRAVTLSYICRGLKVLRSLTAAHTGLEGHELIFGLSNTSTFKSRDAAMRCIAQADTFTEMVMAILSSSTGHIHDYNRTQNAATMVTSQGRLVVTKLQAQMVSRRRLLELPRIFVYIWP